MSKINEALTNPTVLKEIYARDSMPTMMKVVRAIDELIPEEGKVELDTENLGQVRKTFLEAVGRVWIDLDPKVDHREHKKMIALMNEWGFITSTMPTGGGDYKTIEVAIERKEDDLFSSIYGGRLFKQLKRMREENRMSFLVITKSFGNCLLATRRSGLSDHVFHGFIASMCVSGYPPLFVERKKDMAAIMASIARKSHDDKSRFHLPIPPKATLDDYRNAIYEALPRVGDKLRRRLRKSLPTPADLCAATKEDLMKIDGVGEAVAEGILEVLGNL